MNNSKMINIIFNTIMLSGIESSKGDIMSDDPIEDKVYTKRININKDYEFKNGVDIVEVVSISVTADNKWMTGVNQRKIRINMKNRYGSWVNIFIHEEPAELIEFIYDSIKYIK